MKLLQIQKEASPQALPRSTKYKAPKRLETGHCAWVDLSLISRCEILAKTNLGRDIVMPMFNAYLKLIARHVTWLEHRFPAYMFADRYTFNYYVGQLLRVPVLILLIMLPPGLVVFGILHLPVSDNLRVMLLFFASLLFFLTLLWALARELKVARNRS